MFGLSNDMKRALFCLLLFFTVNGFSQTVDSIFFHLYTDSLKKGTHNYINVDGKLSNGKWLPLSSREVDLKSSVGRFEGNDLILAADEKAIYVDISATLKTNPGQKKEIRVWIKQKADDEVLPTNSEYMNQLKKRKKAKG